MIDSSTETLLSLSAAARTVPNRESGRGVNCSTVWRWAMRGVRGVRLETLMIGGVRYTSSQALQRFYSATTAAVDGVQMATSKDRHTAAEDAERELAKAGI